jgi:hypothetical protein
LERSRVRFERREAEEEDRECCGEVSILVMWLWWLLL